MREVMQAGHASVARPGSDPDLSLVARACAELERRDGYEALTISRIRQASPRFRLDPAGNRWVPTALDARALLDGLATHIGHDLLARQDRIVAASLEEVNRSDRATRALSACLSGTGRMILDASAGAGASVPAREPGGYGIWVATDETVQARMRCPPAVAETIHRSLSGRDAAVQAVAVTADDACSPSLLLPAIVVVAATRMDPVDLRCILRHDPTALTGYAVEMLEAAPSALEHAVEELLERRPGTVRFDPLVAAMRAWLMSHGFDHDFVAGFSQP